MAQHQQAKKRIRQTKRRTAVNRDRISRIRTYVKRLELAVAGGDAAAAKAAFEIAVPAMHRGVGHGVLHRNTVARKISRMSARIKALG